MSKMIEITSTEQFLALLSTTPVVVADFYADWCGPCTVIRPVFEGLAGQHSSEKVKFAKVNVDNQQEIAGLFTVTAMPTFIVYKDGEILRRIKGAGKEALTNAVMAGVRAANGEAVEAPEESGSSESSAWLGAPAPRTYQNITDEVEVKGIDMLNRDDEAGPARSLFDSQIPGTLAAANAKGKAKEPTEPDWVLSDTDEQLIVFIPFQSSTKIHSLQITSLPPYSDDEEDAPMRPRTIKLFTNHTHIIGFEDADDTKPVQTCEISPKDWDPKTGTATVELRYVMFQGVSSLNVYFVDGDGDGEKIRVDRLRIFGEAGEKREGVIEKVGAAGN
ncbi:thiol-disulfide exchange intermediate [Nannizzia gypsea CBS 118893]|uniref:Thiol-disulfide exchange intermediate n=1 Tax=Arthroderma gypseum (strain ATCC MYA-4604 / CBS 118893) TaxID=535722 RepID=E4UNQ1_ARTGP|nr:thiol-disulfide exchange intermediate [Nannizzia gypsea CBS 118893]EFQ99654.1 thiol-disulfide exchange intermediate [Nannizzia gypsea CBS 118893]